MSSRSVVSPVGNGMVTSGIPEPASSCPGPPPGPARPGLPAQHFVEPTVIGRLTPPLGLSSGNTIVRRIASSPLPNFIGSAKLTECSQALHTETRVKSWTSSSVLPTVTERTRAICGAKHAATRYHSFPANRQCSLSSFPSSFDKCKNSCG